MKRRVLTLARRTLFTVTELAEIGRVDKSTVSRWCAEAGIDLGAVRARAVAAQMEISDHLAQGNGARADIKPKRSPRTGPSKAQLRQQADWAMRRADQEAASSPADAPG